MAKQEWHLTGTFRALVAAIEAGIQQGSISASLEDSSDYVTDQVQVAVRVFERYSWLGSNRVSLNVTVVGHGNQLFISGITSGGSQAVFFKINTFGEEAFLRKLSDILNLFGG